MSQLEDLLQQCTVKLTVPHSNGWGTGFFVAPGWILTCAHVVREANSQPVEVRWQRQEKWAIVTVADIRPNPYDLALLRFDGEIATAHPCVYLDEEIRSRDPLYLFGYPDEGDRDGEPRTFNCDGLTGNETASILFNLGQVRPGMSGSPLLNQRTKKVCGIVKFTRDRSFDLGGGAIPTSVIFEQFPQLRSLQREFHERNHRWCDLLEPTCEIDFQLYLQSIIGDEDYLAWDEIYTETTVTGHKQEARAESSPRLKLQAETVKPSKDEQAEQFDVLTGLRNYAAEHVLLIGKPGSGKSTSLERLLWEEADNALQASTKRIPVLVKLRRCTSTVEHLIQDSFTRHQLPLAIVDIKRLLAHGRLLLLLDGLNELPENYRTEVANFRDRNRTIPMIVSTRELSVGGTLGITKTLKMLPLMEPQMQEFVRGYLGEAGDHLFQQLKGERLRKFAETPLLLWMLCRVFAQNGEVPTNLGLAFREFTQLYDRQIQEDAPAESREQWSKLLRHLAFALMHDKDPVEFRLSMPREEAEAMLTDCLQQEGRTNARDCAERWLQDLLDYHLLQPVKQPDLEEHIEFRHQLIQEYYAAEYLLQLLPGLSNDQLKRDYLNLLKWTETIALMLALVNEEDQALRVVKLAINIDLLLGTRLVGEVKEKFQQQLLETIRNLKTPSTFRVGPLSFSKRVEPTDWFKLKLLQRTRSRYILADLYDFSRHSDTHVRKLAVEVLSDICTETDVPELNSLLKSPDPKVRVKVTEILGRNGSKLAIDSLCNVLLNDNSANVRDTAARMLGVIGSEKAKDALQQALGDPSGPVRRSALPALSKIDSQISVEKLIQALYAPDKYLGDGAISALLKLKPRTIVPKVIQSIKNPQFDTCEMALELLYRIGSETEVSSEIVIRNLEKLLDHEDLSSTKRSAIATKLISFGVILPNLILFYEPRFIEALKKDKSDVELILSESKKDAAIAEDTISCLINPKQHSNSSVSNRLFNLLVDFNIESLQVLIPILLDHLDSEDIAARDAAYKILGEVDIDQAIIGYFHALVHPSYLVRYRASKVLEKLGSKRIFSELEKMDFGLGFEVILALVKIFPDWLSDKDPLKLVAILEETIIISPQEIRWHELNTIDLSASERLTSLITTNSDPQDSHSTNSIDLVGSFDFSKNIENILLEEGISNEIPYIFRSSVRLLGEIGTADAVDRLLKTFVDYWEAIDYCDVANNSIRMILLVETSVVESLVKIASREGVIVLLNFLESPQHKIRSIVTSALLRGSFQFEIDFLKALLIHAPYEDIRMFSVRALSDSLQDNQNTKILNSTKSESQIISRCLLDLLKSPINYIDDDSIAKLLSYINFRESVSSLIRLTKSPAIVVQKRAQFALALIFKNQPEALEDYHDDLFPLISDETGKIIIGIIENAQSSLKFYNYKIWKRANH